MQHFFAFSIMNRMLCLYNRKVTPVNVIVINIANKVHYLVLKNNS